MLWDLRIEVEGWEGWAEVRRVLNGMGFVEVFGGFWRQVYKELEGI